MNEIAKINGSDVEILHYRGQRVVTFSMVDALHGRSDGTAKRNFAEHRERFVEREDFYELTRDEIRTELLAGAFDPRAAKGIILTQAGYLMLVKPFKDDLAWTVQRQMINAYFATRDLMEELAEERELRRRAVCFALANSARMNRIARLQEAGVSYLDMPAVLGISPNAFDEIEGAMSDAGLLGVWQSGRRLTPVEVVNLRHGRKTPSADLFSEA